MLGFKKFISEGAWKRKERAAMDLVNRWAQRKGVVDPGDIWQTTDSAIPKTNSILSFRKGVKLKGEKYAKSDDFEKPPNTEEIYDAIESDRGHEMDVPIAYIYSNQTFISGWVTRRKINKTWTKPNVPEIPYFIQFSPTIFHLIDGNHQVNAAKFQGKKTIRGRVIHINDLTE